MTIIGIDPGPESCGMVVCCQFDGECMRVAKHGEPTVEDTVSMLQSGGGEAVVVEDMVGYGIQAGRSVFETCKVIGRIQQACGDRVRLISRPEVKHELCHSPHANDANIREALIDLWGGKDAAIGSKKNPGPLYGVKGHAWSALAVAVAWKRIEDRKAVTT